MNPWSGPGADWIFFEKKFARRGKMEFMMTAVKKVALCGTLAEEN